MPPLSAQQTAALRNMQADNNIPPIPRWDTSPATLPAHVVALSNWLHDYADRKYTNHSSSSTRLGRERSTLCAAHHPTISTSSDTTPLRKATGNCRASSSFPNNPDPTTSRTKTLTARTAKRATTPPPNDRTVKLLWFPIYLLPIREIVEHKVTNHSLDKGDAAGLFMVLNCA